MQRFVSSIPSQLRALFSDPMIYIRPASIGIYVNKRPCVVSYVSIRSMKIYTRTGDKGTSGLLTGERRLKSDGVFQALGTIDEVSCLIALAISHINRETDHQIPSFNLSSLCDQLVLIQCRLQALSSSVATPLPPPNESNIDSGRPKRFKYADFPADFVPELENWIDQLTDTLPPLRQFVLPSGGVSGSTLQLARSVCRRAERCVVALNTLSDYPVVEESVTKYLNRLSDYLFTAGRYATVGLGYVERPYTVPRSQNKK